MRTILRTIRTEIFEYAELSDSAKEKARNWWRDSETYFDADFVIDDAKTIGALIGFEIENIGYSGFYSQGDGAHFTGSLRYAKGCLKAVKDCAPLDTELHHIAAAWQKLQRQNLYALRATVSHQGHYQHENCTFFDCEDTRLKLGYLQNGDTEDSIKEIARDFMRWIYKQLEMAYEYRMSDESVAEIIEINEYEFDADGCAVISFG